MTLVKPFPFLASPTEAAGIEPSLQHKRSATAGIGRDWNDRFKFTDEPVDEVTAQQAYA